MTIRFAVLLLFSVGTLFAQVISGTLEGTIYDPNGSLVPGAEVAIQNTQTGLARSIASSGSGTFRFDQLDIGAYRVTVTASGFKHSRRLCR
jgi:hypothetical protein